MPAPLDRLTAQTVAAIMDCGLSTAEHWLPFLVDAMRRYQINTAARMAAFLAQIGHESGGLRYVQELWGPTDAQRHYEGRADLGNTTPGDGSRYRGRGLIQITGRYNYSRVSSALGEDFVSHPDLLAAESYAAISAGWYWHELNLNSYADAGDFEAITRKINGGTNGAADRNRRHAIAIEKLAAVAAPEDDTQAAAPVIDMQPTPVEAKPMAPFIAAAIPALAQAAPDLFRIFGGKNAEKNAQAAEVVAQIAKSATGEATVEGAVNAIQADPAKAEAFRAGVRMSFAELLQLAEHDERSRDAALSRNTALMTADPRWLYVIGGIAAFVVVASYVLAWAVLTGDFSPEVKAMVITGVVIGSIGTVLAFLFGSSFGSRAKDAPR